MTDVSLETPLGVLECRRYDTSEAPDAPVESFWFSLAHPGMPVRYEVPVHGGVLRTTVLSVTQP